GHGLVDIVAPTVRNPDEFRARFAPLWDVESRATVEDEVALADGRTLRRFTTQIRDNGDNYLGRLYVVEDVTERLRLEQQFRQAQKMDAVGRLAGGVAHDFNNLLTVIRLNTEIIMEGFDSTDPRAEDVKQIRSAAERASSLTRQLLAFSRKQILQPRVLDF